MSLGNVYKGFPSVCSGTWGKHQDFGHLPSTALYWDHCPGTELLEEVMQLCSLVAQLINTGISHLIAQSHTKPACIYRSLTPSTRTIHPTVREHNQHTSTGSLKPIHTYKVFIAPQIHRDHHNPRTHLQAVTSHTTPRAVHTHSDCTARTATATIPPLPTVPRLLVCTASSPNGTASPVRITPHAYGHHASL